MILSICPSGIWQINLTLPNPDANDVTQVYPFSVLVFGRLSGVGDNHSSMGRDVSCASAIDEPNTG
jgi:hypothetical protein